MGLPPAGVRSGSTCSSYFTDPLVLLVVHLSPCVSLLRVYTVKRKNAMENQRIFAKTILALLFCMYLYCYVVFIYFYRCVPSTIWPISSTMLVNARSTLPQRVIGMALLGKICRVARGVCLQMTGLRRMGKVRAFPCLCCSMAGIISCV